MSQVKHWKNTAIQKSGFLSDLWDVFISYGGRAAGWILFGCMLCNIIQVIPGVTVPQAIISLVMGVQIVTLDIAGFGLNTIAKDVLKHSQDGDARETAYGAKKLASFLIGLMILTVALITIGVLYSPAKGTVDIIDKVLILARIILIVVYMHTMHDLRQVELEVQAIATQTAAANDQLLLDISQELKALTARVNTLSTEQQKSLQSADIEKMIRAFNGPFIQQVDELSTAQQKLINAQHLQQFEQQLLTRFEEQKNELIASCISQVFDLLESERKETRNTDEMEAVIEKEIPEKKPGEKGQETPVKKREELQGEKPDYWSEVIAKFPRVIEWQSDGLRSVSVEQIMEVTGYTSQKINRAKLPEVKGGKKRINNVLNWLQNSAQIPPEKREVKKPRNTQPLIAEIHALKPRVTVKLSLDDLDDELTA